MQRLLFPILVHASPEIRRMIGPEIGKVAGLALRAVFKERRSLEIAHKQVVYRRHHIAFSSRIGELGDLILELDVGHPGLADRVILEDELKRSARRNGATEARGPRRGPGRFR